MTSEGKSKRVSWSAWSRKMLQYTSRPRSRYGSPSPSASPSPRSGSYGIPQALPSGGGASEGLMQIMPAQYKYEQLAESMKAAKDAAQVAAASVSQFTWSFNYFATKYGQGGPMAGLTSFSEGFSAEELPLSIGSLFGLRYWSVPRHVSPPVRDVRFYQRNTLWVPVEQAIPTEVRLNGANAQWAPGENVAECRSGGTSHKPSQVPVRSCGCGFWAYWDPEGSSVPGISSPDVVGVVEGWGRYIAGTKGFRCQKARVVALHVLPSPASEFRQLHAYGVVAEPEDGWRTMMEQALADVYQVPIFSTLDTMLKAFPPSRGEAAAKAAERLSALEAKAKYHPAGPSVAPGQVAHPQPAVQLTACVVCGGPPLEGGSAMCAACEIMANIAAKNMTLVRCECGCSHAVTAQKADVTVVCACERRHLVTPPGVSPHEALKELKARAAQWERPLRDLRQAVWLNCVDIAMLVATENRAFTTAENARLDLAMEQLAQLDALLKSRRATFSRLLAHFGSLAYAQPGGSPHT